MLFYSWSPLIFEIFLKPEIWKYTQLYLTNDCYNLHIFNTSTAFWGVLNLLWWARRHIIYNYTFFWTNLTVEARLSSVRTLRLHLVFFFSVSECNNCFKCSISKNSFWNIWKIFVCHLSNVQTECKILLPLLLIGITYESNILVFFSLFFFYKTVKPTSNDHILLTIIHTYDCKEW